jgi:hypothetical protein
MCNFSLLCVGRQPLTTLKQQCHLFWQSYLVSIERQYVGSCNGLLCMIDIYFISFQDSCNGFIYGTQQISCG